MEQAAHNEQSKVQSPSMRLETGTKKSTGMTSVDILSIMDDATNSGSFDI
jgi:hypothetical protein